tara:strand:- start:16952 stop:20731 length:3780 start_codon:yes stop_codon:yes gene_type:complete
MKILIEGGNIFKDADKQPLTQRIYRADVVTTLKWLEPIINLPLLDNTLGTTGKKDTSGDLDIAVDETATTKEDIVASLKQWVKQNHPEDKLRTWIAKSGVSVHFKTPINGDESKGFVQTDLMFGNPEFMKWSSVGEMGETYRGQHRMILLHSMATSKGYKWQGFTGLTNRETGEKITDPQQITDILLGPGGNPMSLTSIDGIMNAISGKENYDELVAQAAETFPKFGVPFPDRKQTMNEAIGGPRIQHAEDVVFWEGSAGALRVLALLSDIDSDQGRLSTTIKWDGSPAVVFGRDQNGDFVFTDKSGFSAKGYDGWAKSPEQLRDIFIKIRKQEKQKEVTPGYEQFANNMAEAFQHFEASIPENYRGFFFGDLLYYRTPEIIDGKYEFTPNVVTYRVDPNSEYGQSIADSVAGVVIHREIDLDQNKTPIKNFDVFQGGGLFVMPPVTIQGSVNVDLGAINDIRSIVNNSAHAIDRLLNLESLRMLKMSNFASLLYTYLNYKVGDSLQNLGHDFLDWVHGQPRISGIKKENITNYVGEQKDSFRALWQIVEGTMSVKDDIIHQLDSQDTAIKASIGSVDGGEGYVMADQRGDIKLVDRAGFTRVNRSIVREALDPELQPQSTKNVAIFPGSFKPPHYGHFSIIEYLSGLSEIDAVKVIISNPVKKVRSHITADMAADVFEKYKLASSVIKAPVEFIVSTEASPVRAALDFIENKEQIEDWSQAGDTVYLAASLKDAERWNKINPFKYAPEGVNVQALILPTQMLQGDVALSARDMRAVLEEPEPSEEDRQTVYSYMHPNLEEEDKAEIFNYLAKEQMIDEVSTMAAGDVHGSHATRSQKKKGPAVPPIKYDGYANSCYDADGNCGGILEEELEEGVFDWIRDKFGAKRIKHKTTAAGRHSEREAAESAESASRKHIKEEEELEEMSGMGGGAVQGSMGTGRKKGDDLTSYTSVDDEEKEHMNDNELIREREKIDEILLRRHVRNSIRKKLRAQTANLEEENKLRMVIRKLVNEAQIQDTPTNSTGINKLVVAMKIVIPIVETAYKGLTTSKAQRESFIKHLLQAIVDTLSPQDALAGPFNIDDDAASSEEGEMLQEADVLGEEDETVDIDVDPDPDKFIDIDDPFGQEAAAEDEKKADAEQDPGEKITDVGDQEQEFPTIQGLDETGRDEAVDTYKKVIDPIIRTYRRLHDDVDKKHFKDYLVTNLKLYFDKWENDISSNLGDITTPEYDNIVQDRDRFAGAALQEDIRKAIISTIKSSI